MYILVAAHLIVCLFYSLWSKTITITNNNNNNNNNKSQTCALWPTVYHEKGTFIINQIINLPIVAIAGLFYILNVMSMRILLQCKYMFKTIFIGRNVLLLIMFTSLFVLKFTDMLKELWMTLLLPDNRKLRKFVQVCEVIYVLCLCWTTWRLQQTEMLTVWLVWV